MKKRDVGFAGLAQKETKAKKINPLEKYYCFRIQFTHWRSNSSLKDVLLVNQIPMRAQHCYRQNLPVKKRMKESVIVSLRGRSEKHHETNEKIIQLLLVELNSLKNWRCLFWRVASWLGIDLGKTYLRPPLCQFQMKPDISKLSSFRLSTLLPK